MSSSSPRRRRIGLVPARTARVGAVVVAALLVSAAVAERSSSAFTASTNQQPGEWSSGQMALTASNTDPMVMATMVPGDRVAKCVDVRYTGTVPPSRLTEVKLHGNATDQLADHLDFDISMGSSCAGMGTPTAIASGKLTALNSRANFASGYQTGWTPSSSGDARGFRITVTLPAGAGNEAQAKSATANFAWEVQSTPSAT